MALGEPASRRGDPALRDLAGQLLVVGLPGPRIDPATRASLRDLGPAGVILFARNVQDERQVRLLTDDVRSLPTEPIVLIDQEGGRVDRLRDLRGRTPSARELAERGPAAILEAARADAHDLRTLGVDVNCAPVVDLDEGLPNGLGDRCFSDDPCEAARSAALAVAGHLEHGVLPCLKHFPGLGRTVGDTHAVRPESFLTRSELWERELVPYRLLVGPPVAVMVCHASFPAVGGVGPASASADVVSGLLRRDLGHDGLVLTDDLDMGAVTAVTPEERALASVEAGCDLLLYCSRLEDASGARDALVRAMQSGRLDVARVRASAVRVRAARAWMRAARHGRVRA